MAAVVLFAAIVVLVAGSVARSILAEAPRFLAFRTVVDQWRSSDSRDLYQLAELTDTTLNGRTSPRRQRGSIHSYDDTHDRVPSVPCEDLG